MLCAALYVAGRAVPAHGDLQMDLYRAAIRSDSMTELSAEGLDALIGLGRPAPTVLVMFHEHSCGICQAALPELNEVAQALHKHGEKVHVAHMECSRDKELIKRRAHLKGFPSVLVWRARAEAIGDEDTPEALKGKTLTVVGDRDFLLRAARHASMGEDKDAQRLAALGKEGQVLGIDLVDSTAQLMVPGVGKAWFPLEALQRQDGSALPYHRSEAAFTYLGAWKKAEMQHFMESMLAPLVSPVEGSRWTVSTVEKELYPSLVFCGEEVTQGFVEAATALQGKMRAFHARAPAACPVDSQAVGGRPHVVVYSEPGQQWSAGPTTAKAAVAIAGPQIVADDGDLVAWVNLHRFPGILEISFHNFPDFVNTDRPALIVAARSPRRDTEPNKLVERRLREVGRPRELNSRTDEYTYGNGSYFLAVIDGTLDGLSTFGVAQNELPRVIIFEGGHDWVEDAEELTVGRLVADLQKVPRLWRSGSSLWGKCKWLARELLRSFRFYDDWVASLLGGGTAGHCVLPVFFIALFAWNLKQVACLLRAFVLASLESDPEPQASAGKKQQ